MPNEDVQKAIYILFMGGSFLFILATTIKKPKTPAPVFKYEFTIARQTEVF